jgi:hypothetical protein
MKLTKLLEDIYQQATGKVDDHEGEMSMTDLRSLAHRANQLADHLEKNNIQELEGWVQAKITKAADYIGAVYDNYMFSPDQQEGDCGCGGGCEDCQDESHIATLSFLPSMKEEAKKATCCHRCGRVHVKGTTCKRPYLTGKDSCKNKK